ncbi:class I SAM-dependent methyltransferase [Fulvivirga ulvae]|uniref:class I SAM-dependent methyltransferase n=1 Tax=Fulvivirga ulvae TaxID=2904245 RepID=UPI001F322BB1|nr:class I SAM-dependent methyltransferase [Fulvivirga ulvae]UII29793.1 class I SAM-dependent methyltransferase [Fulvivirga ulvae]
MHSDVYGQALSDYYHNGINSSLLLNNNYGDPEEMPVEVFFRSEDDLTDLEQYALHLCRGKILDIGAGVGVHSLILQQELEVAAIETSEKACEIMRKRGVHEVFCQNIFHWQTNNTYDTLLLLMNGTGISGTRDNFKRFLRKLGALLSDGGQIIIDSSDISYLYEGHLPSNTYFGEVLYQYEYKGLKGEWFPWLYLDQTTLIRVAGEAGFDTQIVYQGDEDEYLAVLKVFS